MYMLLPSYFLLFLLLDEMTALTKMALFKVPEDKYVTEGFLVPTVKSLHSIFWLEQFCTYNHVENL